MSDSACDVHNRIRLFPEIQTPHIKRSLPCLFPVVVDNMTSSRARMTRSRPSVTYVWFSFVAWYSSTVSQNTFPISWKSLMLKWRASSFDTGVPLNVASIVKLFMILICRHITTRPVASLHRRMWNLQPLNENFSGDWKEEIQPSCVWVLLVIS